MNGQPSADRRHGERNVTVSQRELALELASDGKQAKGDENWAKQ